MKKSEKPAEDAAGSRPVDEPSDPPCKDGPVWGAAAHSREAILGPPARVSKPLAAYRLGLLSRTIWKWHRLFWAMPRYEGTEDGAPFAADQIFEARLALADELAGNVFHELPRVLGDWKEGTEILVKALERDGHFRGFPFGSPHVPGSNHWRELCTLADLALGSLSPLRVLYDLGVAIGNYQLDLQEWKPEPGGMSDLDSLPDIRPLVQQIQSIPMGVVNKIPLLNSVLACFPGLDQDGQASFFEALFETGGGSWGHDWHAVDCLVVCRMINSLESVVEEELGQLADVDWGGEDETRSTGVATSGEEPKPAWRKDRGKLYFKGKVIRLIHINAKNIIEILDMFEEFNWEKPQLDPLPLTEVDPHKKLEDTIYELNRLIISNIIKFSTRSGNSIDWNAS